MRLLPLLAFLLLYSSCTAHRAPVKPEELNPIITEGIVESVEIEEEEKKEEGEAPELYQQEEESGEKVEKFLPVKSYRVSWHDDAKICLILGPGMARGFAHAGVIEVLVQLDFPLHCIIGTEMGALVGGLYALNPDINTLHWELFKVKNSNYLDYPVFSLKEKTISGKKLHKFLRSSMGNSFLSDAKVLLAVSVTNVNTGLPQILQEALAANAISASIALSGVFTPWSLRDKSRYSSGASSSPLPVKIAYDLGATHTIVVDLLTDNFIASNSNQRAITREFSFARNISELQKKEANFVIAPQLSGYKFTDFHKRVAIIEEGKKSTLLMIEKMRMVIEEND